jgi:hypothetical protein
VGEFSVLKYNRFSAEDEVLAFVTGVIDEGWDMMEFEDLILRDGSDELLLTVSHEDRACVLLSEDEAEGLIASGLELYPDPLRKWGTAPLPKP